MHSALLVAHVRIQIQKARGVLTATVRRERGSNLDPVAVLEHLADDLSHVELCPAIRLHVHLAWGQNDVGWWAGVS